MRPEYPKPGPSKPKPNLKKADIDDMLDLGWAEGVMSDGRPYRFELWCVEGLTLATILFATAGLEGLTADTCAELLQREDVLKFPYPKRFVQVHEYEDTPGERFFAVNIVIGDENAMYAAGGPGLQRYTESAEGGDR